MSKTGRHAILADTVFDGMAMHRGCAIIIEGAAIVGLRRFPPFFFLEDTVRRGYPIGPRQVTFGLGFRTREGAFHAGRTRGRDREAPRTDPGGARARAIERVLRAQ